MILEEQRLLHEDLERLEQAIADRILDEPKHIRERLNRDHEVAGFLTLIQKHSQRLLNIYKDKDGSRAAEIQAISTGDPFEEFNKQLAGIKDFHRRYPNEIVENLERAYKKRTPGDGEPVNMVVDNMFTGEEAYGRFFDLTSHFDSYMNLPGVKDTRRPTYIQYLDTFDTFTPPQCPMKRPDKMTDAYFRYLGELASYLESFMRRIRPLENLDKLFAAFDREFEQAWESDELPGWQNEKPEAGPDAPATEGDGIWCPDCQKGFGSQGTYNGHLSGKKHIKNANARAEREQATPDGSNGTKSNGAKPNGTGINVQRLKEKAVAAREFRVKKLASAMQTERSDTRVNVERKAGMTDRERQAELATLYGESEEANGANGDANDDDENDDKIYNPLKLPLAWDGKPIPFWLYKLHGLGVEFPCEICGNFVYMGRRAFDKHFNEARHIHGLKCLGITNTTLFREITGIEEAQNLWNKIQNDKKKEKQSTENVVQMEDAQGNVMPEKVYYDLLKQGLL
ncbi:hypothetical protein K490DRAFT_34467 [Saccharata proteae CBS 121410]|uniref:Matrin-type domain-containing protein n=1 Tax=Saccharata proteae CBS 121410 TaxID=1314787 RepID=A0A9P4LZ27_9PEZI|nr:hypothetical protein K490DRAFT_34467 [Saccharata proteae CBS 121410]